MALRNPGATGFPAFGLRVDSTITYHPKENTYADEAIPSSEPGTAQVQWTIEAGDLPTFSPYPVPFMGSTIADQYTFQLYVCVRNPTGGAITLYGKKKTANTPTYATATSGAVNAGKYGVLHLPSGLTAPALGDAQEIKLYGSATGLVLQSAYMIIYPKNWGKVNGVVDLVIDVSWDLLISGGTRANWDNDAYNFALRGMSTLNNTVEANLSIAAAEHHATYGLGYVNNLAAEVVDNAATAKIYKQPYYPTRIAYTPLL